MTRLTRPAVLFLFSALAVGAVFAAGAVAAPVWKFESEELKGSESIAEAASESTMSLTGLTTTCDFSYGMTVSNSGGKAGGSMNEMALDSCVTDSKVCTVEEAAAEKLPWSIHGALVSTIDYVLFEGIEFTIAYAGENCVLEGVEATFAGSAGGKYDNTSGTFAFNPQAFTATGTGIEALGTSVAWNALFTTEALGAHKGQTLELG